jgi:glc operon protein GlcG
MIAASLIFLLAQAPAEAPPLAPHNRTTISAAMADVVMDAAVKDAVARQAAVAIVIVDENGEVVQSLRMDGVRSQFVEIARRKAWTSAFTQQPSRVTREDVMAGQNLILSVDGIVPFRGGMPIMHEGKVVGAVGASGAASETDEAIAVAAVGALAERLSD